MFHVSANVPVNEALSKAPDLQFLTKAIAQDAALERGTDCHTWPAHYLTAMSKAIIDDVVKSVSPRPNLSDKKIAKYR